MEKVSYMLEVPKESKEVVDCLCEIVVQVKAGKSVAEIAAMALPKLIAAIDGYEKLPVELKSDGLDEVVGYSAHKVIASLRG